MIQDTEQSSSQLLTGEANRIDKTPSYVATVMKVYSDRNTVDVRTAAGAVMKNVPVLTKGGLIDNEVFGEFELPAIDSKVIIDFVLSRESMPYVSGVVLPYLHNKFQASQVPVNSSSKQFTKKLLEVGKDNTYRKIFPSGATLEVQEDGSIIWESPSGSFIQIKESDGKIIIEASGDMIELNGNTKDFVTHAELDMALQSFINALNLHVHGSAGTPPTVPMSLDISSAKATKLKTG